MSKRRNFPSSVTVEAIRRASKANGFPCCEVCGTMMKRGQWHFDHIIPDRMGGEPTLENCAVICVPCHAQKTSKDVGDIARAKRLEAKHSGAKRSTSRPMLGSRASGIKIKMNGAVVSRE